MAWTPCSQKDNWVSSYDSQCFIARNPTTESLLIGHFMIKALTRYKGTWYKYVSNSFNFRISEDHTENYLLGALNLL